MLGRLKEYFPFKILTALILSVALAVALRYLYDFAACGSSEQYWLGAAIVNSLLAVVVVVRYRKTIFSRDKTPWSVLDFSPLILLVMCGLLALSTIASPERQPVAVSWENWLWVLWIPLIEELVFRVGFGGYFRRNLGVYWGTYFSVLLFCLAHTVGSYFYEPLMWFTGIPLGVLLLGVCCEVLYIARGRVSTIVLFHMAANFSVILFKYTDSRWLRWLGNFYTT